MARGAEGTAGAFRGTHRACRSYSARRAGSRAAGSRDWAAAERHYRRALEWNPDLMPLWVQLGHAMKERGEYAGASIWDASYGASKTRHPAKFAVADGSGARLQESAYLLKKTPA